MKLVHNVQAVAFVLSGIFSATLYADPIADDSAYCTQAGGLVKDMPAQIVTRSGTITGPTKAFCVFSIEKGLLIIGLETFASDTPSIAATYIKSLPEIAEASLLWKGTYSNPSHNVCKNLGGAAIGFVAGGGFTDEMGESDICVFGDTSMVSAWSLIYMANHRDGYDAIKNQVKAEPMDINMPN